MRAAAVPDDARETRWAEEVVPQLVVGDAVWLSTPHRARVLAIYATPGVPAKGAVLVVHGAGVHPDWGLIGEIRSGLVERGFATLSVQMPVLASDAPRGEYASLEPSPESGWTPRLPGCTRRATHGWPSSRTAWELQW